MSKRATQVTVLIVGVLTLISFFIFRTLNSANVFATLKPSFDGTCVALEAPQGPEDLVIDRRGNVALVSSTDRRRAIVEGFEAAQGDIYLLDLGNVAAGFSAMGAPASNGLESFLPHGISLYRDESGRTTLMAVNHPAPGVDTVEIFDLFEDEVEGATVRQLVHRRTVQDRLMHSPNDVVAVSHDAFYATNDHGSRSGFGKMLEDYLRLNKSNVVFFDGEVMTTAAKGLTYANGIEVSADGLEIVVAETTDNTLRFFDRDLEGGRLTLKDKVNVFSSVDNIDRASDGSYWVGSHPQVLKFTLHASDPTMPSPSHVLRVVPPSGGQGGKVEQIYLNLGDEISGSSVAAEHNGQMLIGQVFDPKILLCDLPD